MKRLLIVALLFLVVLVANAEADPLDDKWLSAPDRALSEMFLSFEFLLCSHVAGMAAKPELSRKWMKNLNQVMVSRRGHKEGMEYWLAHHGASKPTLDSLNPDERPDVERMLDRFSNSPYARNTCFETIPSTKYGTNRRLKKWYKVVKKVDRNAPAFERQAILLSMETVLSGLVAAWESYEASSA